MWITICFMIWLGTLGLLDLCYRKVPIWLMAVGTVAAVGFALCRYLAGAGGWEGLERIQRLPYDLAPGGILLAVSMITGKTGLADGIVLLATGLFLEPGSGFAVFSLSLFILALFSVALGKGREKYQGSLSSLFMAGMCDTDGLAISPGSGKVYLTVRGGPGLLRPRSGMRCLREEGIST